MISYEEFKRKVEENFYYMAALLEDVLPSDVKKFHLESCKKRKVNDELDGIQIHVDEGDASCFMSPVIYINDMYEEYKTFEDLEMTMLSGASHMAEAIKIRHPILTKDALNIDNAKDNTVFQLINTKQNKELLASSPHRDFLDLSVVYRWVIGKDKENMYSAIITNELAERIGVNEEQLFKIAAENTQRVCPPVIKSMDEMLREMLKESIPAELVDMGLLDAFLPQIPPEYPMYIITNDVKLNGASSMLYEDELHNLSEKLGTDLYILPSSIHEVIAVSTTINNPKALAAMVEEINMTEILLSDRLSNQVYHYDKDLRKITLATNTPNKSLNEYSKKEEPKRNNRGIRR